MRVSLRVKTVEESNNKMEYSSAKNENGSPSRNINRGFEGDEISDGRTVGFQKNLSKMKVDMPDVEVEKPFSKTTYCKELVAVLVLVGVTVVVVPTAVCLTGHCGNANSHWSYEGSTGPVCWHKCYATCGGSSQSPVDLDSSLATAVPGPGTDPLVMVDFDVVQNLNFFNNGHSVQGDLSVSTTLSGLGLPGTYRGQQFHFHWGGASDRGSEHTVNGKQYPMEIHLVHYSANYSSFEEAADKPDGVAVLGFLYEVSPADNPFYVTLVDSLDDIKYKDQSTGMSMAVEDLFEGMLPVDFESYYRYSGSLTTPACAQSVVWTVLTQPVQISEAQMNAFRNVHHGDANSHQLYDNYRPVIPLRLPGS